MKPFPKSMYAKELGFFIICGYIIRRSPASSKPIFSDGTLKANPHPFCMRRQVWRAPLRRDLLDFWGTCDEIRVNFLACSALTHRLSETESWLKSALDGTQGRNAHRACPGPFYLESFQSTPRPLGLLTYFFLRFSRCEVFSFALLYRFTFCHG